MRSRDLAKQIVGLTKEIGGLVSVMAPAMLALPGCGPLTAAKIVGETAGVDRFKSKVPYVTAATPREFVDTEDRHQPDGRIRQSADPAQQRRPAERHTQRGGQSRAGPAGQRKRDGYQRILQAGGALPMPLGQTTGVAVNSRKHHET